MEVRDADSAEADAVAIMQPTRETDSGQGIVMARRQKKAKVKVSDGEMEMLSMLWHEGPVTLSEAYKVFHKYGAPIGKPTVQTRLNRLAEKGLAIRSDGYPAEYVAAVTKEQVAAGHLEQLLDNLSAGSAAPLVCQLISERPLTIEEITELRELLAEAEKTAKKSTRYRRGG